VADERQTPRALRLTFSYDGDKIDLVSRQSVEMIVPPSDPVEGTRRQAGFWLEVKGDGEKTVYRRMLHDPLATSVEAFSEDPQRTMYRAPSERRSGVFSVVVPEVEEGHFLSLVSSPSAAAPAAVAKAAEEPAVEIARFDLRQK
jgi:hypothetical protein